MCEFEPAIVTMPCGSQCRELSVLMGMGVNAITKTIATALAPRRRARRRLYVYTVAAKHVRVVTT